MPVFSVQAYLKLVRASAIYDLVLTAGFATPWSFEFLHRFLSLLNQGLGGGAFPDFTPFHLLLTCMMGSIVVVWSLLRIRHPEQRLGRYDGIARLLFSSWMFWAWLQTGAPLLLLFFIPELSWGIAQWWPVAQPEVKQEGRAALV